MTDLQAVLQPRLAEGATRAIEVLTSRWVYLVVALLFVLGLGIRLYQIDSAPLDFHAARQYRSFIIARDLYYDTLSGVPQWQREVADASAGRQGTLEPPILASITVVGYRLLGGEELWLPRVLSSLAWLVGGAFLFSIIRRVADPPAAVAGVAFYLLLPFAVAASRSFQPDPLMVTLILASVWSIVRYDEAPSYRRLLLAAAISSLAFVSQPRAAPVVVATFLVLLLARRGPTRAIRDPHLPAFLLVAAALPGAAYGYTMVSGAFRTDIAAGIFLPQLWTSTFLWRGWLANIGATVGLVAFVVALLGVLTYRPGRPLALVVGLWLGYASFGLVFDYSVAVDDYYHLQLVPIVAISVAPVAALVVAHVAKLHAGVLPRLAIVAVLAGGLALVLIEARGRIANPDWQREVAMREEIGALVDHSSRTIFLSGDYGTPLEYHGMLAGSPWPLASDLEWEHLAGVPSPDAEDRFRTWFEPARPEYFIVEDLSEFERQPDLTTFLARNFPLLSRTDSYAIYDLRPERDS